VLFARSPYAFSIEHRHTFLAPIVYMLAVAYLHILLKFPSFLDSAYLSSCGSVAGSTAFTLSFPLFRPLTHLARRVSFTVSDSHISNPRLTESRACIYGPSPPLYLCAFSPTSHDNLHRRAAVRLSVNSCTFCISLSFSPPSQTTSSTPEKLLANRLATLTFLPGLNLSSPAQVSFAHFRSIQYCDLFLSCLYPNSQ
jgi:hypothetical protein